MATTLDHIDLLALELYAAALDEGPLDPVLTRIAAAFGADAHLTQRIGTDAGPTPPHVAMSSHNIDPGVLAEYHAGWIAHDPWLAAAGPGARGVFNLARLVRPEDVLRGPYWNEFLLGRVPTFWGLSTLIDQPGQVTGLFTVWRDRPREAFGAMEEVALRRLSPHLRRAFLVESRLRQAGLRTQAIDGLREGIAVLDPDGRVVEANPAFLAATALADGLSLTRQGLRAAAAADQTALTQAIGRTARMAGRRFEGAAGGTILVVRPSGRPPWRVEVLPLPAGRVGGTAVDGGVVLLVAPMPVRPAPEPAILMRVFELTAAEADLAISLFHGRTITEHAKRRRIAVSTARTHLSNLLRKMQCRRQAEVVSRLVPFATGGACDDD